MVQLMCHHQGINMDMPEFEGVEDEEEDYNLEDFF